MMWCIDEEEDEYEGCIFKWFFFDDIFGGVGGSGGGVGFMIF